jgi:hypothetical protein
MVGVIFETAGGCSGETVVDVVVSGDCVVVVDVVVSGDCVVVVDVVVSGDCVVVVVVVDVVVSDDCVVVVTGREEGVGTGLEVVTVWFVLREIVRIPFSRDEVLYKSGR